MTTFISPLLLFSDDHPHSYSPLKRDMCVCVCVANCNWNQLRDASRACEDLKKSLFMIGSQLGRTIAMGDEKSRTFVDRLLLFHCWFDPWMNNYIFVFIVSSLFFLLINWIEHHLHNPVQFVDFSVFCLAKSSARRPIYRWASLCLVYVHNEYKSNHKRSLKVHTVHNKGARTIHT